MKYAAALLLTGAVFTACNVSNSNQTAIPLIGTWQLISATATERDSTYSTFHPNRQMIKIISKTHFAFFSHDLNQGKDSTTASFIAGGGTCILADSVYTEHLEYFIDRAWEGHQFQFVVKIHNDTLTQSGVEKIEKLGIDRAIVEKYVRVKE